MAVLFPQKTILSINNHQYQIGGAEPTGNIDITTTDPVDVKNYATAQVKDNNLLSGNIRDGVTILGIEGTYSGQTVLYPPVVTYGRNVISWANDPRNGSFGTVTAEFDGIEQTSPWYFGEWDSQMSREYGLRLHITVSEPGFEDKTVRVILPVYWDSNQNQIDITPDEEYPDWQNGYWFLLTDNSDVSLQNYGIRGQWIHVPKDCELGAARYYNVGNYEPGGCNYTVKSKLWGSMVTIPDDTETTDNPTNVVEPPYFTGTISIYNSSSEGQPMSQVSINHKKLDGTVTTGQITLPGGVFDTSIIFQIIGTFSAE